MRGKHAAINSMARGYGITPADAGKTFFSTFHISILQDHPRGCGENDDIQPEFPNVAGSPPRMRGKLRTVNSVSSSTRITPADAGKTAVSYNRYDPLRDHPRGCGENSFYINIDNSFTGSPPRMRGKLHGTLLVALGIRITPADAGKTSCEPQSLPRGWDHPRGCGENSSHPHP